MANPYREIFAAPGARSFALAGLISRLPFSMMGIGIITMLVQSGQGYGLAGMVAAIYALAAALLAPQISRLVDRYGQSRVLPLATTICVAGIAALLACAHFDAPNWTLCVFAAAAGCIPSMPAMTRARWTLIFRGKPELNTAFSLESVLDEMAFIVGPPISVGLSVALFPEAGPLIAAIMLVIGVTIFVLQKETEPPVQPAEDRQSGSVLRHVTLFIPILALLGMGVIVGTVDVVSVAFAEAAGRPVAASLVLSLYALGSCLAGLAFGAVKLGVPLPRLFLICALATAATVVPLFLAQGVFSLAGLMFISGLFFAPSMIVAMRLGEAIVPPSQLTEGLTWMTTGLGIGVAGGAAMAGAVVERFGVQAGFGVAVAAGVIIFVVATLGYRPLSDKVGAGH